MFIDHDNSVFIKNGSDEVRVPRTDFLSFEPEYSLPSDAITRFYNGQRHWVSDGVNQRIATDISNAQIDGYLDKIQLYKSLLETPSQNE